MSSANRRLHIGIPSAETDVWWSWSVSSMVFSRNKLNWTDDSKHPWQTPVVLKNSPSWLFKRTALLKFSYRGWMAWTRSSPLLELMRICYRPPCLTLSHAFLKSMKLRNRSRWGCRCFSMATTRDLFYCSTVYIKAAYSSVHSSSAMALSRLRITRSMILLGWLIRMMVR